jgi:hypothetical protein
VGIADGLNFPDALSGGVHIEHRDGPIVLTDPNSLPASTQNYLSANTLTIRLAYIYGGGYAVSAGVQSSVTSALGAAAGSTTTTTTPPS